MEDVPDFESMSEMRRRWFVQNFSSPHHLWKGAMAALEKKEKQAKHGAQRSVTIQNSNIANLNLGSQVGEIAAHAIGPTAIHFHEYLRQMFRIANLGWSLLNKPDKRVTPRAICKQVDDLRAALAILYGKCPSEIDSQPLVDAIEKLDGTRKYRVGNLIGSQAELDQVCGLMDGALAAMRSMIPEECVWRT
jgi:hypothetical protein